MQDIRFALRFLRRRRLFAAVAITTIALGAGAATSVYSVVDGVLLRPLPFREPGRLVGIWQTFPEWRKEPVLAAKWDRIPLSFPEYRDVRDQSRTLESVAIWTRDDARLTEGERTEVVSTLLASSSLLTVLGTAPWHGRMFLPADDVPNAPGVALVSYEQWQARFGGEDDILGRVVHLDERPYTIIGVLPPNFSVGRTSERDGPPPAFWTPAAQTAASNYANRTNHNYDAVARLAPGVTPEDALREVSAILGAAADQPNEGTRVVPWHADQTREARGPLFVLLGAVGLLLLIACANVATLLVGEAATREHELAARFAMGAQRTRIVRQLLTESLVLAAAGGIFGSALAWAGTRALVALAPPDIPGLAAVQMDARVLAFALATIIAIGLLFGLAPALASSRADAGAVLHGGSSRHSARGRGSMQRALVAGELALSVVLLVGAGLLLRSFDKITAVDPGFRPTGLLVVETSLPFAILTEKGAVHGIYDAALARVGALPGVQAATIATQPPFSGRPGISRLQLEGETGSGSEAARAAEQRTVAPGYFPVLGVPLLAGRDFSPADREGAPLVVVVSEALARRDFPSTSPIGRRIRFFGELRTIVGVVGDVRTSRLTTDVQPALYLPFAQRDMWTLTLVVRTSTETAGAGTLTAAIRRSLAETDPRLTATTVKTMDDLLRSSFAEERYRAMLMTLFGALAGLLAAVGTYGVTSRAVTHRAHEVGIRLALGATPGAVVRQMVGSTLAGVVAGVVVGLVGSTMITRALTPFLFGVSASDPTTYAAVVMLLAVVSVGASWLPARRVGQTQVTRALRSE